MSAENVGTIALISYFIGSSIFRNHYSRFSRRYKWTIAANTKQFEYDNHD